MSSSGRGYTHTGSDDNNSQVRTQCLYYGPILNLQGSHWCSRGYGTGSNSNGYGAGDAYHYSNS